MKPDQPAVAARANADGQDVGNAIAVDPKTTLVSDSFLIVVLGAGSYAVALTRFGNFPMGFPRGSQSSGFAQKGNHDYASIRGRSNGQRCESTGNSGTSAHAVEIAVAAIPLPASLPLALAGAGLVVGQARRRCPCA